MASGRIGLLGRVRSTAGYVWSLRPYRWSSIAQRTFRKSARRIRRLPGGRTLAPDHRHGFMPNAIVSACPVVEPAWARLRLETLGIHVEPYEIDVSGFKAFLRDASFPTWYSGGPQSTAFLEKTLEHYVGAQLVTLGSADVYIDVGADNSPFATIATKLYGCTGYQLDSAYRPGIHGRCIGSDVRAIAFPDGSVDKMAAHCAFDHFQGDADAAFLAEAVRVLRPGGRLCILPLYLAELTTNFVDTAAWISPPLLDPDAAAIDVPGWGYEFSRYYSPERFLALAARQADGLSLRVFEIVGAQNVHPGCYLRMAAIFERRRGS
jgi:SAM-dependent methyltransferase